MAEQETRIRDVIPKLRHRPEELYIRRVYFSGISTDPRPHPRTGRKYVHWTISFECEHNPDLSTLMNRAFHISQSNTRSLFGRYFNDTPTPGSNYTQAHTQTHHHNPVPQAARSSGYSISHSPRKGAHISINSAPNRGPATSPVTLPPILTNSPPTQVLAPIPNITTPPTIIPRSSPESSTIHFVGLEPIIHPDDRNQYLLAKDSVPVCMM